MTNKELQTFLKQFPDDTEIWKEELDDTLHLLTFRNMTYWLEGDINHNKVKKIVF